LERFAEASRQFEAKKRTEQARAEQEQERAEQLAAIEVAIASAVQVDDAPHFVVRMPARWLDGMSMAVRKCVSAMAREFGVTGKGIVSQSRIIILTVPRHCAIGIALEITGIITSGNGAAVQARSLDDHQLARSISRPLPVRSLPQSN
jgi:uncharacterized protein (DUF1800 family)